MYFKVIIFLITLFLFSHTNAQNFLLGPQIGINLSSIGVSSPDSMPFSDMKLGYKFGLFSRIYISNLYIQPEINYSMNRSSFDVINQLGLFETNGINISNIQNTLLIGYRLGTLRISLGPTVLFKYKHSADFSYNLLVTMGQNSKSMLIGMQAGLGFNIARRWNFDIVYNRSFSSQLFVYQLNGTSTNTSGIQSAIHLNWGFNLIRI